MKKTLFLIALTFVLVFFQNCSDNDPQPIDESKKGVAARWADETLHTIQKTPPNSPTYSSRSLGYIGLTMYESVVHGSTVHKSLSGQLPDLDDLPLPESDKEYNWVLALNAGQALMLKNLYPHASTEAIDNLELTIYNQEIVNTNAEVASRSVAFGKAIATAIFEWSKTDGGHEGYLHLFDPQYVVPSGYGYWTPPVFGQSASMLPLHPYWGENRTFVLENKSLPIPEMIRYSSSKSSPYYAFFKEVYDKRKSLTAEEKRIAAWWADDPTQTASPPGHSYNLATIVITTANADMFTAAEVYAKVGMAVADAFICCWKCKYQYHAERPFAYIRANIDFNYQQFWPEPPFPAFSSGHATQSAATAIVLINVFGNDIQIVDNTHANRSPDFENISYRARTYRNIWSTATECAYSRFLGGIHTRQDNEAGTEQGKAIGENIISLAWKK